MKSEKEIHVYFMPGMSANSLIFERIKLQHKFKLHFLEWIQPEKDESLNSYAKRLSLKIVHDNPILVGVSFGGVIIQEISKIIDVRKLIIISSIKSKKEMSNSMKFAKKTKSYKLLPVSWLDDFESLMAFVFGPKIKRRVDLYRKYLSVRNKHYLEWSIEKIINWDQEKSLENIIHIHGTKDSIFPVSNIKNYIPVKNGGHAIILKNADWLNDYFSENLI
ncbi:MAG: alpha/beta hydrolase [Flavobacteriaceae bacterium]|nr:alpha/beta hydrolase [Flavobacteriaceae bacterium]